MNPTFVAINLPSLILIVEDGHFFFLAGRMISKEEAYTQLALLSMDADHCPLPQRNKWNVDENLFRLPR